MKKSLSLLSFLLLFNLAFAQQAFEVMTKNPTPGSVIVIEYVPRNTVLQGVADFEATAYMLEGKLPRAVAVPLKKDGGIYKGSVKTADSTRAVFFSFAKDEKRDNNNDEGYYTMLYTKQGALAPGANSAVAVAFNSYGSIWDLKRNADKASAFNKAEFASEASQKKYASDYLTYLSNSKDPADAETLRSALANKLSNATATEQDLIQVRSLYQNKLKDKVMADSITAMLNRRNPGTARRTAIVADWNKAKSITQREAVYQQYTAVEGALTENEKQRLDFFVLTLARMYADSGNYARANEYMSRVASKPSRANALNGIAWKLSGEGLNKQPKDVKAGLGFSAQSLALIEEEKKAMKEKPSYLTDKQYHNDLQDTYHTYGDTYATLLYHDGQYQKAYDLEAAAVAHSKRKNVSMNEAYTILTEKLKGKAAAQAELVKFYEEGKYTPAMKEQLKALYTGSGKTEEEWNAYAANLEQAAYNKLKEEVAKKVINLPAPQFALKNLKGENVDLASLKGKVVVVDFWATWCGPCIASFPGMQMAVKKFKDNPNVQFVFIDTWENDSNRVQKVTDFIAKNNYDFNVLYDNPKEKEGNAFVVVEDYKVDGIPTKFVIGPTGNIRFKSVGFSGSAEAIVSELSAMIDIAGGGAAMEKKGL